MIDSQLGNIIRVVINKGCLGAWVVEANLTKQNQSVDQNIWVWVEIKVWWGDLSQAKGVQCLC